MAVVKSPNPNAAAAQLASKPSQHVQQHPTSAQEHPPLSPQLDNMNANGLPAPPTNLMQPNGVAATAAAVSSSSSSIQPPFPPKAPKAPTALSRQNTSSSLNTSSSAAAPMGEPVEMLRQTLQTAPNSRPTSRSSSRRRFPPNPTTPRNSTIYTPNGSGENSEDDAAEAEIYRMRHGFEDEYNSEDYLAVLEQVRLLFSGPVSSQPTDIR